jgi:fucose permease
LLTDIIASNSICMSPTNNWSFILSTTSIYKIEYVIEGEQIWLTQSTAKQLQLQDFYHLSYIIVSLLFLSPFIGYTFAAILNNSIHMRVGRRGVAMVSSCSHLVAYVVISVHPPYPVLVIAFALAGFGNGVADAAWNAFVGNMDRANEILGFLHGLYGAGAVLSPLIATTMITKAGLPWYAFYYLMVSV